VGGESWTVGGGGWAVGGERWAVGGGQRSRDPSTSLRAGFGTEGTREQGARQEGSDSGLCGLWVKADHGTIVRREGVMIGKLGED
jgi:hypothetical protein